MKKKTFDCVEMMHEGARLLQDKLAGMSEVERAAYWKQQNAALRAEIRAARKTTQPAKSRSAS
jgi:hypothetical protein